MVKAYILLLIYNVLLHYGVSFDKSVGMDFLTMIFLVNENDVEISFFLTDLKLQM